MPDVVIYDHVLVCLIKYLILLLNYTIHFVVWEVSVDSHCHEIHFEHYYLQVTFICMLLDEYLEMLP